MSRRCYFHPDCKSPIYGLPKDDKIREKWLSFIFNSSSEHNNPNIFLCAAHFTEDSFINREEYNAGIAQMLNLKKESVPTLSGQRDDNGPNSDVDCCETSVYVTDGSSTDSLDSVSIHQDQLLMDRRLSSGPTQDSELGLTLLCYSESDSDQEDESNDKSTKESHDIVCNAKEQQEILQTTVKTCSVQLEDCTNLMEIKIETIEEECDTEDDDDEEEDKNKRYDEDDDFDNHCIPSDEINGSSDEAKTHKCPYCKKTFPDALKVKSHVRLHTEEKPYQCSICGKTFRLLRSLRAHEITHREEKPFPCSHCDKRFSNKNRVMVHERVHTGEKPYLCQDCGKSFSKSHSFRVHLRVHTGEKPYQCSQCEKSFARPEAYRLHRRAHTGVKPYQCSFCGKSFTRRDNLSTHQRIHTGEKPYKCTQCDLGFTQAVLLRLHQKKHTGGKP